MVISKTLKYDDLMGFGFSRYSSTYYGIRENYEIKFLKELKNQ
jgi:hypothetical protein